MCACPSIFFFYITMRVFHLCDRVMCSVGATCVGVLWNYGLLNWQIFEYMYEYLSTTTSIYISTFLIVYNYVWMQRNPNSDIFIDAWVTAAPGQTLVLILFLCLRKSDFQTYCVFSENQHRRQRLLVCVFICLYFILFKFLITSPKQESVAGGTRLVCSPGINILGRIGCYENGGVGGVGGSGGVIVRKQLSVNERQGHSPQFSVNEEQ